MHFICEAPQGVLQRGMSQRSTAQNLPDCGATHQTRPKKFAEGGACRRHPSVSYPSLRSRRIAGTFKRVTKILSSFFVRLAPALI